MIRIERSERLFAEAQRLIPGGVNSPVRAFGAVGGTPRFIARGEGAYLFDVDGNRYIDLVGSWGPLILGHAHPAVVRAVTDAASLGLSFGAPCENEVALAKLIADAVPGIEQVRMVSSGTEAAMSAVRLARAFSGKSLIVKAEGGYHGHADPFLVAAGSGAATFGVPTSPGVPAATVRESIVVPYNDATALERVLAQHREQVACVILEPVAGNMGTVVPAPGYLAAARDLAHAHGALLIFDEVITGFRLARGGAQERYGVVPDITVLGKIIGGGMPVGAFGARREIMQMLAPEGPVYQAGTLSGNPVAMAAGRATVEVVATPGFHEALEATSVSFFGRLGEIARAGQVDARVNHIGSLGTLFFAREPVTDYASARLADTGAYRMFFHKMLERGVYIAPSQFECLFVSAAHSREDLEFVIGAAEESMREIGGLPR